ncbi:MAG: hypothetical protein QE274_03415 [Verrucomicrobiaceae bacterium]|nr:hypothetical protein [Verrucomicrobiaceae bacterium]
MRNLIALVTTLLLGGLLVTPEAVRAQGFTESDAVFYGEVRMASGGQTHLLQSGQLKITFVNQSNAANRVTLETTLRPTGNGDYKPYSYALNVPLAYLPEASRMNEFLAVNSLATRFKVEQITINGVPATLPDGSSDFYVLNFASKAGQYRLDLLVAGESNSTANDGIPDWWKRLYGLDVNANVANADPDGDGWSNLQEYQRGGNPMDSNQEPILATLEVIVPEMGEAGLYVQVLDSDSPDSDIVVELAGLDSNGLKLNWDGAEVPAGSSQVVAFTDLKAGRATVSHHAREVRQLNVPIRWSDGGDWNAGELVVQVTRPTEETGGEASLWLDGMDLGADSTLVNHWPDRSGSNRAATQPLPDYQPVVKQRAVDFSTNPAAHLFMRDSSLPMGDHTVLISYQAAESSDLPQTLISTNRGFLQVAATTQPLSYPGAPVYQMDQAAVRGFERTKGTTTSIFRRQGSVLHNIYELAFDGEGAGSDAIDPVLPTLGARRSAMPGTGAAVDETLFGGIQELLIYPTALPEQKLRGVNDYLQSKWRDAVIWNFSTELKRVVLNAGGSSGRRIIRGGFGDDLLTGGAGDDILSGGGGDDHLIGGGGVDSFVFGAVDLGRDTIADFDPAEDVIDVSALFWGAQGDARDHLSVRLETSSATSVPTLDSILMVKRVDQTVLEIRLQNRVVTETDLLRWVAEGQVRMGKLTIPTSVQLARIGNGQVIQKALDQSFKVQITRTGAGVPAELEVPVGFFAGDAAPKFIVDGAVSSEGQRSVVSFARGETSKTLTVRPVPDLDAGGLSTVHVAVLPSYKYAVEGGAVEQKISDSPSVWVEVTEPNAAVSPAQAARVKIRRNGGLSKSLVVYLKPLGGTAVSGKTVSAIPSMVTFGKGIEEVELRITPRVAGLSDGPKVAVIRLASRDTYLLGSPHEGTIYIGNTLKEAQDAGFDRWLANATGTADFRRIGMRSATETDYSRTSREQILAYALGLDSAEAYRKHDMQFRVVNSRPEFANLGTFKGADLRWRVQASTDRERWVDVGSAFKRIEGTDGVRLVGPRRTASQKKVFYRISMSLASGQTVEAGVSALAGDSRYGIVGSANWSVDGETGALISSGGAAGKLHRLFVEVEGPAQLHFAMGVTGAGKNDLLSFYTNGVLQTQSRGAMIPVTQTFTNPGKYLLMWEFKRGIGNVVIQNLKN